jgi:vacuolar-type H+-ATPase subunit H
MNQEVITRLLNIESEAVHIRDEAQREAERLIEEGARAAAASREEILAQAHQEAEQMVADGQKAADQARARVVAQAQEEAQRTESAMVQHLGRAVQFVLAQVTGRA